jgi:hypothetical protein
MTTPTMSRQQRAEGQFRAFTTVVLLTLHRKGGEIGDATGAAARELLGKAQLYQPVVPSGLSNVLHKLRAAGIILTDTYNTRTYSIRLARPLSQSTVDALKREEAWAHAFVRGETLPELNCSPPEITFAAEDEVVSMDDAVETVSLDATEPSSAAAESEPVVGTPRSVPLGVSPDTALLMRIVSEQAEEIASLRAQLGLSRNGHRPSSEVVEFLSSWIARTEQ